MNTNRSDFLGPLEGGYHAPDSEGMEGRLGGDTMCRIGTFGKRRKSKKSGKREGIDNRFLNYQPEKYTRRRGDTMPGLGGYHKPDLGDTMVRILHSWSQLL
jgi:hypothetical protein